MSFINEENGAKSPKKSAVNNGSSNKKSKRRKKKKANRSRKSSITQDSVPSGNISAIEEAIEQAIEQQLGKKEMVKANPLKSSGACEPKMNSHSPKLNGSASPRNNRQSDLKANSPKLNGQTSPKMVEQPDSRIPNSPKLNGQLTSPKSNGADQKLNSFKLNPPNASKSSKSNGSVANSSKSTAHVKVPSSNSISPKHLNDAQTTMDIAPLKVDPSIVETSIPISTAPKSLKIEVVDDKLSEILQQQLHTQESQPSSLFSWNFDDLGKFDENDGEIDPEVLAELDAEVEAFRKRLESASAKSNLTPIFYLPE